MEWTETGFGRRRLRRHVAHHDPMGSATGQARRERVNGQSAKQWSSGAVLQKEMGNDWVICFRQQLKKSEKTCQTKHAKKLQWHACPTQITLSKTESLESLEFQWKFAEEKGRKRMNRKGQLGRSTYQGQPSPSPSPIRGAMTQPDLVPKATIGDQGHMLSEPSAHQGRSRAEHLSRQ